MLCAVRLFKRDYIKAFVSIDVGYISGIFPRQKNQCLDKG